MDPDDPAAPKNPWNLMPQDTSPYPWRLANDADFDITGHRMPQGDYRSVVWGSEKTFLYSMHPDTYGKKEIVSMWGFPYVLSNWNYHGYEGAKTEMIVFSNADEVELLINNRSVGRKAVYMERPLPFSVRFDTVYEPGEAVAVSYRNGKEVSRDRLVTTGAPAKICLHPEKNKMLADGHDLIYVGISITDANGLTVPDAEIELEAKVSGEGYLAGFGSAAPITEENYTDEHATTYRGRAMVILRSGYTKGSCELSVSAAGFDMVTENFAVTLD